ncbi:MAG: phosphoglycolate phosphatase-like HAD superfamily hydrolase [Candidatus Azotimanducaceae bacterium]|jgi:phosphoglycolate phosphatase-like HAD superfamily hydrolase
MIKAIIFDWDGVIADSMSNIAKGIQETAASYGVTVSIDDVLDDYMQPREAYYQSLGIDTSDIDELSDRHDAKIAKYQKSSSIFSEAAGALTKAVEQGFILGICSNGNGEDITDQLHKYDLMRLFSSELILGNQDKKDEKLQILIERLALPKETVLYVGDLPTDISAAQSVGIQSAGIQRREKARLRLAKMNPDYLFSSLADLKSIDSK